MIAARRRDGDHGQKIRESCNGCSSQKIRCGKQRPRCARCSAKGLECSYSYSQRTGRRAPSAASVTAMSTPRSPIQPTQIATAQMVGESAPFFSDHFAVHQPASTDLAGNDAMMFDSDDTFKDLDMFAGMSDTSFAFPEDFQWSPVGTASAGSSHTTNNSMSCPPTDTPDLTSFFASSVETSDPQASNPTPVASIVPPPEPAAKPIARPHQYVQDCMARALQVVSDLHIGRNTCRTTALDPMAGMQPPGHEQRDVDAVLFQNRDAVKILRKILDCQCSSDDGVALACYLATSKIVAWYGAAMGLAPHDSSSGVSQSMVDQIMVRPIFMGSYCLDADAQRAVRARVTLSEMREQIQPLLSRLPKHQVSRHGRPDQSRTTSPTVGGRASDGPECALRSQLKDVIQEATDISKAA